ncbi:MAG TPA: hypothetical protein VGE39_12345, partial [Prosthecobacter sp.]
MPPPPRSDSTMNTTRSLVLLALTLGLASAAPCRSEEPKPAAAVLILDDLSGIELMEKHGIRETSSEDLKVLRDAVLSSRQMVRLFHDIVDEKGQDNEPLSLVFRPFSEPSPTVPLLRGTLTAMQRQKAEFDSLRADFQRKLRAYAITMQADIEAFMRGVTSQQMETAARFDDATRARNGRDYNHSDVANAILTDVRALGTVTGLRVLIINSDMVDLPFTGEPRKTPFTTEELPADVTVIFVNTSHQPDASPLFRGTPNPRHHAGSMRAAMELVATWLPQPAASR